MSVRPPFSIVCTPYRGIVCRMATSRDRGAKEVRKRMKRPFYIESHGIACVWPWIARPFCSYSPLVTAGIAFCMSVSVLYVLRSCVWMDGRMYVCREAAVCPLPCSKRTVDVDYVEDWQTGACIGPVKVKLYPPPSCLFASSPSYLLIPVCCFPLLSPLPPAAAVDKQPPRPRAI